jgi:carnitine O-acetyltransferase
MIFADPGWDKLNMTILSTSNCGNPSLRQFGFGPASGDGFGIGYIIKDDGISICVASKHRQTKRFANTLESYLLEIRRILRITARPSAAVKQTRAREVESIRPKAANRLKSRGRLISGPELLKTQRSRNVTHRTASPGEESVALSEDDGLGGCEYSGEQNGRLGGYHYLLLTFRRLFRCGNAPPGLEGSQ